MLIRYGTKHIRAASTGHKSDSLCKLRMLNLGLVGLMAADFLLITITRQSDSPLLYRFVDETC
jgi:hypothetical protein